MLRELRGAITALALVVCLILALATVNLWLPGQSLLQSLRFHVAAALFGLVVLLALTGAWRRSLLFLIPLVAGAAQAAVVVYDQQLPRMEAASAGAKPLFKVVSFNVLTSNPNGRRIADYLVATGADVVMLVESTSLQPHLAQLRAAYPYAAGCEDLSRCGTLILSRTPLVNTTLRAMSDVWPDRLVTTSTVIDGTSVNLVLAHMVKPYFDEFPYVETYHLAQVIKQLEGPLLLAGDFNAAAWSDNINWLAQEASLVPPPVYPATWPVRAGPLGVPIDNLFTRTPLLVEEISAFDDAMGSNHRGLIAEVALAAAASP